MARLLGKPKGIEYMTQYTKMSHKYTLYKISVIQLTSIWYQCKSIWAHFLLHAQSKLRLCSANQRPGYWSNLLCDWPSRVWAYSEQETENEPRFLLMSSWQFLLSGTKAKLVCHTDRFSSHGSSKAVTWTAFKASCDAKPVIFIP